MATSHDVQVFFYCVENDTESMDIVCELGARLYVDEPMDTRFSHRIQKLYRTTHAPWFLTGADDVIFRAGWQEEAEKHMETHSVISFQDLNNPALPGTNFLIERAYIEQQSGVWDEPNRVFHDGYFHNFVDNELVAVARSRGQFIQCDGVIEHFHPTANRAAWDDVYEMAQGHFVSDAEEFNRRMLKYAG